MFVYTIIKTATQASRIRCGVGVAECSRGTAFVRLQCWHATSHERGARHMCAQQHFTLDSDENAASPIPLHGTIRLYRAGKLLQQAPRGLPKMSFAVLLHQPTAWVGAWWQKWRVENVVVRTIFQF